MLLVCVQSVTDVDCCYHHGRPSPNNCDATSLSLSFPFPLFNGGPGISPLGKFCNWMC